jgi:hypothetical protein
VSEKSSVVAIYGSHIEAENAVKELQRAGFDMSKLSVACKTSHDARQVVGYYNLGGQMKYWGRFDEFWGSIWSVLAGAAFFRIPGIGPIVAGGPLVSWVAAALEGTTFVEGLSLFGAALYSAGIPRISVVRYETAIRANKLVLLAFGTPEETRKAKEIIAATNSTELILHGRHDTAAM